MSEIWRDVTGCEGFYRVSSEGRVLSLARSIKTCPQGVWKTRKISNRILPQSTSKRGYKTVELTINGGRKRLLVHRLAGSAFIENEKFKPYINHIDSNPSNNNIENLEWVTHAENMDHARRANRMKSQSGPGSQSPAAKLTDSDVIQIKIALQKGESHTSIASRYPVGKTCISEIKAGRSWSHILLPRPEDSIYDQMCREIAA